MSKGNLFLGQARGKVGSVVFSRAFGEQITRTRPTSVANPKTIGQNTQRAILATIAKSAAAMTSLVDHSFAGVTYGAESVRHFRKVNMGLLRNLYLNTQNGANLVAKGGNFVPNPLKVSEGSLPSFFAVVNDDDVAFKMSSTSSLPTSADVTVSDFLKVYPGLQGGDQITLVKIVKANDGELLDGDALFTMVLDRIVFAPNAFDDQDAIIIANDEGVIANSFLDLTKTTNPICVSRSTEGGLGFTSGGDVYYTALILSRKVNNVWQRSTQYLEQVEFDDHTDNESAIASYGAQASLSDATEYLNQADEGDAVAGLSGPYMQLSGVGTNAFAGQTINIGQTVTLGDAEIETGEELILNFAAYGTADNPLVALDLTGTNADGSYNQHASVRDNAATLAFNVGEDGNLVGSYTITAVYRNGRAVANFTLSTGA